MRTTRTSDAAVVADAQAGDRRALEQLATTYLPLVYTIVRRGLGDDPDVDDVVQDVMLRALRKLPKLRTPDTFRAWLAAIAIRQVGTYQHRRERITGRIAAIEEAAELADPRSPSAEVTALQVDLSRQRRQAERAGHWLDPDDQVLLSLWWLEIADQLTRADVAAALGLSLAHAGVRVQRMRTQLETSRALVAALDRRPRCPQLAAAAEKWDGTPSPLWRKRLTRHVRTCPVCTRASEALVSTERLLPAFALLSVPVGLGLAVLGKLALDGAAVAGAAPVALLGPAAPSVVPVAKVGLLGQLVQGAALHPVVSTIATGALVAGAAITTVQLAVPSPPAPRVATGPARTITAPTGTPGFGTPGTGAPSAGTPSAGRSGTTTPGAGTPGAGTSGGGNPGAGGTPAAGGKVDTGPLSLESQNAAGRFVAGVDSLGVLVRPGSTTDAAASFTAVEGLADTRCVSFRAADGRFLRHASWRVRLDRDAGTALFRGDATFCPRTGSVAGSVALEASNYPGWFVRHRGDELWVDQSDGSAAFLADGSFRVRPPLTR